MYDKILVPLDMSDRAECALSEVEKISESGVRGKVTLLHVVDVPVAWMPEGIDVAAVTKVQVDKAKEYLSRVRDRLVAKGIETDMEVREGRAAEGIIEFAVNNRFDLIVIGTHGYTGMKQLMFGSVALRVLHDAHIPVLLIRAEPRGKKE